jgi:FkbM family methyltransferase
MIIKYFKWHCRSARKLIVNFINSKEKDTFCFLQNLRFRYLGLPWRFSYVKKHGCYKAYRINDLNLESPACYLYFLIKERAHLYYNGLDSRLDLLASAYFLDQVKFNAGDLVVDCGANVGEIGVYLSNHKINYMAFEPSQKEFGVLEMNCPHGTLYQAGLWNTSGEKDIWISSHGADSSLIEPLFYTAIESIKTYRLDKLIGTHIRLLKVEAEGGEPEVIEGCQELLPMIDYISADLGPERGVSKENTVCSVTNLLLNSGFELCKVNLARGVFLFRRKNLVEGC